jgi:hypothetical protein
MACCCRYPPAPGRWLLPGLVFGQAPWPPHHKPGTGTGTASVSHPVATGRVFGQAPWPTHQGRDTVGHVTRGQVIMGHVNMGHVTMGHVTMGHVTMGHVTMPCRGPPSHQAAVGYVFGQAPRMASCSSAGWLACPIASNAVSFTRYGLCNQARKKASPIILAGPGRTSIASSRFGSMS